MGTDTHLKNNRIIRYTLWLPFFLPPSLSLSLSFVSDTSQDQVPQSQETPDVTYMCNKETTTVLAKNLRSSRGNRLGATTTIVLAKNLRSSRGNRPGATTIIVLAKNLRSSRGNTLGAREKCVP